MFWLILLIVVAALCALVLFFVAPAAGRKELRTPFAGRNFAHRGYFGKDQRPPENSLPAFAAAVQNGYGMEMDVQFSSDRKLLVFHDDTLTRMTGTKGWVRDYPYDQIYRMPLKGGNIQKCLFLLPAASFCIVNLVGNFLSFYFHLFHLILLILYITLHKSIIQIIRCNSYMHVPVFLLRHFP